MRYRVGFFGIAVVLPFCIAGWYVRPIVTAQRIGISWRTTLGQSHCAYYRLGEFCTTNWPVRPDPSQMSTVTIEPWTRTLLRADRFWGLRDSAAWARLTDSTRRALTRRGWEPLPCDTAVTHFPIAEAWRIGDEEVQLYAAPAVKVYEGGTRGVLTVQLVPYGGGSCGPRYRRRLLTPDEMAQRVHAWVSEQIGLW
jgi:hypothetical protein